MLGARGRTTNQAVRRVTTGVDRRDSQEISHGNPRGRFPRFPRLRRNDEFPRVALVFRQAVRSTASKKAVLLFRVGQKRENVSLERRDVSVR